MTAFYNEIDLYAAEWLRNLIAAGHIAHYTPEKTTRYESHVRLFGAQAMGSSKPMAGPLGLGVTFVVPVPQSYSKKRTAACLSGAERPAKKPDLDNMLKAIKDGLNGVTWADDCQVVEVRATKVYGEIPRAQVVVETLEVIPA